MSIKYLAPVDLGNNELQNVLAHIVSADPTGIEAKVIYNSTGHVWKYYNGTSWVDPLARANHSGTQLAATISDFNTAVRTNRLDQMATPTADVALGSQKITGLADPTAAQDAATKAYADALSTGLDFKASVRVATTANITLSGAQTIDGVSVIAGDRVLVKNQSTGANNGIYVAAAGAWARATDADSSAEVTSGMYVFVSEGTANADSSWVLSTNDPIVLATTALTFVQFSGAGQLTAGNGIAITANSIATNADSTMFQYNSGVLALTSLYSARKFSAAIGDGSTTAIVVTHNLATRDLQATVLRATTPWDIIHCDIEMTTTNTTTFRFTTAPTSNQYRVVIVG